MSSLGSLLCYEVQISNTVSSISTNGVRLEVVSRDVNKERDTASKENLRVIWDRIFVLARIRIELLDVHTISNTSLENSSL